MRLGGEGWMYRPLILIAILILIAGWGQSEQPGKTSEVYRAKTEENF